MSGLIAKFVFNKVLCENPDNNHGADDPYFETLPAGRLSAGGRTKKRKKALPPGLSREDEKTLIKVKRRAYRLDMALGSFCGMRVGWSSLIAIIPGIGDILDMMLAMMVIRTASQANLPSGVRAHMMINVIIDFVIGLIPFLGDIVDVGFKANTRNAVILENFLRERGAENIRRQGLPQQPDPSLGDNYDRDEQQEVINQQQLGAQPPPSYQRGGFLGRLFGGGAIADDVEAQRTSVSVPSSSRQRSTRHGSSRRGSTRHGQSRHGSSRHGSSRHGSRDHSLRSHGKRRSGGQESGTAVGISGR
ncbi:hypothetical protein HOY80DRAFT_586972 [Tuber brumale]|nr:hypothetical protein HOY80DRAFT_586972 [Tuber brumale]